jgi:hypothetical protein
MPEIDADITDLAPVETIEGEAAFADQESIEGTHHRRSDGKHLPPADTAHSGPYCERHARFAYLPRAA